MEKIIKKHDKKEFSYFWNLLPLWEPLFIMACTVLGNFLENYGYDGILQLFIGMPVLACLWFNNIVMLIKWSLNREHK